MAATDIVIRRGGDETVGVVLVRRVTGAVAEEGMWDALTAVVPPAGHGVLVLDCGQVQHVSSLGLGRLLALAKHCREARTRLVIRGLCPSLRQLFHLLRIDVLLEIEADHSAAGGNAS